MVGDTIAVAVVLLIIGGAIAYIVRAKKSGKKCIGCPDSCSCNTKSQKNKSSVCGGNCGSCSGCCGEK